MTSRFRARLAAFLALLALLQPVTARGDTLTLDDRLVFGRLISLGPNTVRFAPNCAAAVLEFPRRSVKRAERNTACKPRPIAPYSAGGGLCTDTPLELYEVRLKRPQQSFYAAEVVVVDGRLHIRTPSGLVTMHGPDKRFVSATRALVCRTANTPDPVLKGFCVEETARAINFGTAPVFENRILTQGISFYLEDDRGRAIAGDDPRGQIVQDAFGNAITQWMGALQDLGPRLPAALQARFGAMVSPTPGGYSVLMPPQVVRLGCPDTAMFIVRYLSSDTGPVTIAGTIKAARAQVAGRTIYINGVTYPCWRASLRAELVVPPDAPGGSECMNLTPIFVHELGHAFGLPGHRDGFPRSIMDSLVTPRLIWPTENDALELAGILLQPIAGTPAGRLDADAAGVGISLEH